MLYKIIKIAISLTLLLILNSCVQQSEYDKLNSENKELKQQIDELENGAERLYKKAFEYAKTNEFDKADEKLKILFERHNETEQAIRGRDLAIKIKNKRVEIVENSKWETSLLSNTIESYESYNSQYPNGKYINNSKTKIVDLIKANEQNEYDNALNTTSSSTLRDFISKYPNNKSISSFKKKLIQLEIDDIFGDRNTGQLPSFERNGYKYSSTSSIEIENGTDCELIVRYSGGDIKMIEIPAGATSRISLISGSYRIAASACGSNYAGTETCKEVIHQDIT